MKITWAKNPLETRVELDDVDKFLMRERLKVEYLEDRLVAACIALNPVDPVQKANSTIEERVERARRALDIDFSLDDEERNGQTLSQYLDSRVADYAQELMGKHVGDCTCVPCSCLKCHAENMLGINTIEGLGKHSSYKIDAAFKGDVSIDEAIRRLENYQPTYDPNSKWPRSDWEQHVPRWNEEGKRAHAWLVAYRDEHFVGVDHEQR